MKKILRDLPDVPPPLPPKRKIVDSGMWILIAFTGVSGALVLILRGWHTFLDISLQMGVFLAELTPKIVGGIFIAATLPLILPKDRVAKWIGADSGFWGLVIAMLAGIAIPGGPGVIFSLAAGFGVAGADLGAIIAFTLGSSLLSLNRTLIWEFSFLPADLVFLRNLISLPLPLLAGWVIRRIVKDKALQT